MNVFPATEMVGLLNSNESFVFVLFCFFTKNTKLNYIVHPVNMQKTLTAMIPFAIK